MTAACLATTGQHVGASVCPLDAGHDGEHVADWNDADPVTWPRGVDCSKVEGTPRCIMCMAPWCISIRLVPADDASEHIRLCWTCLESHGGNAIRARCVAPAAAAPVAYPCVICGAETDGTGPFVDMSDDLNEEQIPLCHECGVNDSITGAMVRASHAAGSALARLRGGA